MAPPEVTGDGTSSSTMEATTPTRKKKKKKKKKPRKRKKSSSSGSAAESAASSSSPGDGNGNGDGQQLLKLNDDGQEQQQYRGKQRIVWTDELHGMFVKAYDTLGKDAVPKKILALMNVDGLTRENVASHLQKYRLSLKREEQRIPDRGDYEQAPLRAEASSPTAPLPPLLDPPTDQAPAAPSTLHPLPPQPRFFTALNMSQLQIGHQQIPQTPATNLLLHPPHVFPMVQPIQQQRFMPPLEPTVAMWPKLVEEQEAGLDDATTQQAAAAASGGYNYNPMLPRNNVVIAQTLHVQVMGMNGGISVPEVNLRFEAAEMHIEPMLMAAKAEGQGRDAERVEMAAKAEEGQGRAAEPTAAAVAAAAGSLSPPSSSIVGQFWKSDEAVVSWDFGFPRFKRLGE